MSRLPTLHDGPVTESLRDREQSRALRVFNILGDIIKRTGEPTATIAQMSALSALAEAKAIWQCLKDKGLVTEEQLQVYLDRGVDALAEQTEKRLNRVMVDSYG